MTAISMGRRVLRTALAAGAAGAALVALTGCERPAPNAHFTLGSHTTSREPVENCHAEHGDGALGAERVQECIENTEDVAVFTAGHGDTLRVGVDPEVAEDGWLLFYNGILYDATPFTSTYQTFEVDELYAAFDERNPNPGALPERQEMRLLVAQVNDEYDRESIWSSESDEQYRERMFGSFEGVWNVDLEPED